MFVTRRIIHDAFACIRFDLALIGAILKDALHVWKWRSPPR